MCPSKTIYITAHMPSKDTNQVMITINNLIVICRKSITGIGIFHYLKGKPPKKILPHKKERMFKNISCYIYKYGVDLCGNLQQLLSFFHSGLEDVFLKSVKVVVVYQKTYNSKNPY